MKKYLIPLSASLLLAACGNKGPATSEALELNLQNPLYAEQYYDQLVDSMVTLEIQNDPLTKDEATMDIIRGVRTAGLAKAKESTALQAQGQQGNIVSDYGYAAGEVLILDNTLYIGPGFYVEPGPNVHVHLSSVTDPREGTYPDENVLDLGIIKDAYGAQTYPLPTPAEGEEPYRVFVLWDDDLKRVYGFSQLYQIEL